MSYGNMQNIDRLNKSIEAELKGVEDAKRGIFAPVEPEVCYHNGHHIGIILKDKEGKIMSPEYLANHDFNKTGSNCNPFEEGSNDWIDYERAFERRALTEEFNLCL